MTMNARWRKSFERSDKIRLVAHLVTSAKPGVAAPFRPRTSRGSGRARAPITTKQFVENFKAAFS
jgi:hypothetical protein